MSRPSVSPPFGFCLSTGIIALNRLALLEFVQTKHDNNFSTVGAWNCKIRGVPTSILCHRFLAIEWAMNISAVREPSRPTLANADLPCNSVTFHIKRLQKKAMPVTFFIVCRMYKSGSVQNDFDIF